MTNDIRIQAGVPTGGQFAEQNRPDATVELTPVAASAGWSPKPELVKLIESPVGGNINYWVHLKNGGVQVFDLERDLDDDSTGIEYLQLANRDGELTITAKLPLVDFTHAAGGDPDDEDAAAAYLNEHQDEIEKHLADKYGLVVDTATDWSDSGISVSMDYTAWAEADTDGALVVTTENAKTHVLDFTSLNDLVEDIKTADFFTGIRERLDQNEQAEYNDLGNYETRADIYQAASENGVNEWAICGNCAEKTPRTHQFKRCLICGGN